MTTVRRLIDAVVRIIQRDRLDRELEDELDAFLQAAIDRSRADDLTSGAARRAARVELGSAAAIRDAVRDVGWESTLDSIWQDVQYALRMMRRSKGWTAVVVLSLTFGIGGTSAIGFLIDALFLRPPAGVSNSRNLVDIGSTRGRGGFGPSAYPDLVEVRARTKTLDSVYGYSATPQQVGFGDPATGTVAGVVATSNYFTTLGAVPAAGRLFTVADGAESDTGAVAVVSYRFWTQHFNGTSAAVGHRIVLNGVPFTVVGVASKGFRGTGIRVVDVWVPVGSAAMASFRGISHDPATRWLLMGGRLAVGASRADAAAEIRVIGDRPLPGSPDGQQRRSGLRAVGSASVPGDRAPAVAFLALLGVIVVTVLAIACANVSGLLLARAAARRQELAVRQAIGAGRGRLIRQMLTETMVLFAAGASGGLLLARWAMAQLAGHLSGSTFALDVPPVVDRRIIIFTAGVTFAATVLTGLAPAWLAAAPNLTPDLKRERGRVRLRLRHGSVAIQVALSTLLIVMGGFSIRALQKASTAEIAFNEHDVELAAIDLGSSGYPADTGRSLVQELVSRVRALPGVIDASAAVVVPGGFETLRQEVAVAASGATRARLSVDWDMIEPGYFSTLGARLVAGRDFARADDADATPVAIISETVASAFWPDRWPGLAVGERLTLPVDAPPGLTGTTRTLLIVGVVPQLSASSLIDGLSRPAVYVPFQQAFTPTVVLVARTRPNERVSDRLRTTIASIDPRLPVSTQTLSDSLGFGLLPQRVVAALAGGLGAVGLLLVGIGVYGVTAYVVTRRTREVGLRMALGAPHASVVRLIAVQALWPVAVGLVPGLLLSAAAARVLRAYLFGIPPFDPMILVPAAALFITIALAACAIPTRRAIRIQPIEALRCE